MYAVGTDLRRFFQLLLYIIAFFFINMCYILFIYLSRFTPLGPSITSAKRQNGGATRLPFPRHSELRYVFEGRADHMAWSKEEEEEEEEKEEEERGGGERKKRKRKGSAKLRGLGQNHNYSNGHKIKNYVIGEFAQFLVSSSDDYF